MRQIDNLASKHGIVHRLNFVGTLFMGKFAILHILLNLHAQENFVQVQSVHIIIPVRFGHFVAHAMPHYFFHLPYISSLQVTVPGN